MIPLILLPFLPEIKKMAMKFIGKNILGGTDDKNVRKQAKAIYKGLPAVVRLISEERFVSFCVENKDKIFPADMIEQKQKTLTKKRTAPAKRVAKKKAAKKKLKSRA